MILCKVLDIILVSYSHISRGSWTYFPLACRHVTSNRHVQWADSNQPLTAVTQTDLPIISHTCDIHTFEHRENVSVSIVLSHLVEWLVLLYSRLTMNVWLKQIMYHPYNLFSIQLVLFFRFIATSAEIPLSEKYVMEK